MADPVVGIVNGVPTSGTGTITTLGMLLGTAGTPTANVQSVQGVAGGTAVPVSMTSTTITGTVAVTESGTWTVQPGNTPNTTPWLTSIAVGANTAAVKAASTAPVAADPALVVSLSPNSVNANGRKTPANSAPVVQASQQYQAVAASATATVLGTTGAIGDWLDFVLAIPASTSPGAVSITDGAGSAITVFAGGASSVASLVPFAIPVRAVTASGAWKVTTGASISVLASGNFT